MPSPLNPCPWGWDVLGWRVYSAGLSPPADRGAHQMLALSLKGLELPPSSHMRARPQPGLGGSGVGPSAHLRWAGLGPLQAPRGRPPDKTHSFQPRDPAGPLYHARRGPATFSPGLLMLHHGQAQRSQVGADARQMAAYEGSQKGDPTAAVCHSLTR